MGFTDKIINFFSATKKAPENLTNLRPRRAGDVIKYDTGLTRTSQDVGKWRRALISAESKSNYNRTELFRLLKDVALDSHLSSIIEQRKNATLCRNVCYYNSDGTENEEVTRLFKASWFGKLRAMMLDAKFYGFTLVDLGEIIDFKFPAITQVPREYVKPELGIVVSQPSLTDGISIDDPKYAKWNLFFGEKEDLGLLVKAAPWALWKKTVVAYWSEYCEKFGMPMRVGKTNIQDETLKANMESALKNMGSAFWALMDKEDTIELLETFNTAAYDIYDKFIERANSEMSKLILSQTGTTDEKSFVGSANVHQDVLGQLIEQDVLWHDNNLNEIVRPALVALGFPVSDGYFETGYEEKASLKDKVEMIAKFMPYLKFDKEYLEEEFDIVIESVIDNSQKPSIEKDKKKINDATRKYYDSL
jgi:hypothetical protein